MKAIIGTILAAQFTLAAQQTAPPAAPKSVAQFQTTTQLVVVNVAAKTRSGAPVTGLKASDFTVTEDGKPQLIKVFEYQQMDDTPLAAPALARRETETAVAAVKPAVAPSIAPAKTGEIKYKDRRLLVLFFDRAGMAVAEQLRAQQAALQFLNTQIAQSDLIAVMTYSTDLSVLQDFTGDRDLLTKVVKANPIGDVGMSNGSTGSDSEGDTGAAYTEDDSELNFFNTDRKLAALESAV